VSNGISKKRKEIAKGGGKLNREKKRKRLQTKKEG
jgi:hypothetical protein